MRYLIAGYLLIITVGIVLFTYHDASEYLFGATCLTDPKTNIYEKYTECNLTPQEKIDLVAHEIEKIGPIPRFTYNGYDIQVTSIVPFDKGVEVYIRAWTPQGQIGFGPDGSVDIEKVRIIDPSILVPDTNGTVTHTYTNSKGQSESQKYKIDPREAMLGDLILAIRQKSVSDHIIANKVGNTTTIQPASQDNALLSDAPTANFSTDATLYSGDDDTGASVQRNPILTFDVAGSITAGSTINSATLSLFEYNAGNGGGGAQTTLTAYRVLRNWSDTQSTYNVYTTGNNWTTAGANGSGTDRSATVSGTIAIDGTAASAFIDMTSAQLAADVQNMLDVSANNFGWKLDNDGSNAGVAAFAFNYFRSSNFATAGDRPKLVIDSTLGGSSTYDDDDEALGGFWP